MDKAVITSRDLDVFIDNKHIIKKMSFSVGEGEIYALLGGNGAGKSTLLKTFLGFYSPTEGDIQISGLSVTENVGQIRALVAYLPESAALYGHFTPLENIRYFLSLANVSKTQQQIEDALFRVALQPQAWSMTLDNHSKGMCQKTAIALALLRETQVLFLDEPTSGLDPVAIDEFNRLVSELSSTGTTILMVTHDVYGACQVAHRIGLLRSGELMTEFDAPSDGQIDTQVVHQAFSLSNQQ